ncbi:MAG: hypothetical protein sGL2_05290 [Candidatus Mesenet longicola]|nr:MAG: hypothetical protein sGL2_05290 [Candidatus Mesenet longicola]
MDEQKARDEKIARSKEGENNRLGICKKVQ